MQECFVVLDRHLHVKYANHRAEIFFKMPVDEMRPHQIGNFIMASDDYSAWEYYHGVVTKTGEPVQFTSLSKNDPDHTLSINAFPYDGDEIGFLFSSTSAHQDALATQRKIDATHAAIAADLSLCRIDLNVRGGLAAVDDNFVALTGFGDDQLRELLLTDLVHPHDRGKVARTINSVIEAGGSDSLNIRLLDKSAEAHPIRLNVGAVAGASRSVAVVGVIVMEKLVIPEEVVHPAGL